ncbi:expressed unknown protein [Seminavis robusta]|uniref:CRAL-TRIO domain-containing protein n=1 Tax=Seminavis robusta TaxID=568900 RepID=A0A9N8DY01_9STRA|nr:expressed unknown protein [Seminavis robusta]|eukprot:Sro380_g130600.1 n/a (282) ;mRNA; f:16449-17294
MDLTARERQWALGVKEAVRLSEDIDSALVSDFDVACHALIGRGDETQALERIKGMETFRRTYGIDDSVEQGSRYMQEFVRMQPGALLKLESCPITQEGVVIWDAAAFCSSLPLTPSTRDVARGPWNWEVHVVTAYYMLRALHSCFDSVREGVFLICECDGSSARLSVECETRLYHELGVCFPYKVKQIMCYNTGSKSPLYWSLLKPMMPQSTWNKLRLGCRLEDEDSGPIKPVQGRIPRQKRRLSEFYLQSTMEGDNHYVVQGTRDMLARREGNETAFRLS